MTQPNDVIDTAKGLVAAALTDAERCFIERIAGLESLTLETVTNAAREAVHAVLDDAFPLFDALAPEASIRLVR